MADEEFIRVTCPKCDALIATAPKSRPFNTDGLICSNCGAELSTSSSFERAAEKATRAIEKAGKAIESGLSGKSDPEK
jgi:hydrogenase maturation factor HypF (carbamoyltransferase family)